MYIFGTPTFQQQPLIWQYLRKRRVLTGIELNLGILTDNSLRGEAKKDNTKQRASTGIRFESRCLSLS